MDVIDGHCKTIGQLYSVLQVVKIVICKCFKWNLDVQGVVDARALGCETGFLSYIIVESRLVIGDS
jgi:hypothetical protein